MEGEYPLELREKLKGMLRRQVEVVESVLGLHARFSKAFKGLQEKLEESFGKMKAKVYEF